MTEYSYLGKSQPFINGRDKVSGHILYAADFHLRDMLCGKILHSPLSHARIGHIDVSKARNHPGVKALITAQDTPCKRVGRRTQDRTMLAWKKVRYAGEPVAAVAAVDEETALEALDLIRVEYEELPAVFDPLIAMKPGSPLIHEEKDSYEPVPMTQPVKKGEGNVLEVESIKQGDVEQALKEADLVYHDTYRTQVVHHGFIETHGAVAEIGPSGRATLWTSTKAVFIARSTTAKHINFPVDKLRVIAPAVGGDFGGKGGGAHVEPICLLLALKARLPVKMVLSREEEFLNIPMRDASVIELTMGVKKNGTLVAARGQIVFDTGAYCDHLVGLSPGDMLGNYRIPNLDIFYYAVYTNNTPRGFVRAPRKPHPIFAVESHMDMIAHKLGIDPLELRLKNAVEQGDRLPQSPFIMGPVGFKPTLEAAAKYLKENKGAGKPNRGWGVACGKWGEFHPGPIYNAMVKINEDGSAAIITGVVDQGAGQYSVLAQIVAEVLSIHIEAISVVAADTETTPFEQAVGASSATYRVGNSARLAAEDARRKLLRLASTRLEAPPEALELKGGRVFIKSMPDRGLPLANLAAIAINSPGGQIIGQAGELKEAFLSFQIPYKDEIDTASYSTHLAEVEVDPDTGKVKVLRYFAAHDVGFALNPQSVKNQIEGGIAFGLGYALTEQLILHQGKTLNNNLTDYKLPDFTTIPPIDMAIIEVPSRFGPYGAKGVGEPPVIPVAPAIANAVYDAVGVRITELPITAERVFFALREKKKAIG